MDFFVVTADIIDPRKRSDSAVLAEKGLAALNNRYGSELAAAFTLFRGDEQPPLSSWESDPGVSPNAARPQHGRQVC